MPSLFNHQKDIINTAPDRWLFAWGTGTMKTRPAIELAARKGKSALVVVPKALPKKWRREIDMWRPSDLDTEFVVMTKEEFRRSWETLRRFDVLIIDEAHHFAGFRNTRDMSEMHKAAVGYVKRHDVKYIYCLTATPYLSTPMNIFALSRILRETWNYMKFKNHFFVDVSLGRTRIISKPRANMENDLKSLINKLGNTVALSDVLDVPEQIFETVNFDLTENQKAGIKSLNEPLYIKRWTKVHQIENGVVKGDEYTQERYYECLKNDYIESVCEENAKVAVFCRYTLQIAMLEELLTRKLKKPVYVIQGSTEDRDSITQAVEGATECVVLINSACAEGYELPSVGVIVYASLDFSLKNYIQSQGRFLRGNALKKNVYIHLISGDVDQAVYDSMMRKEDFHLDLYAKEHQNDDPF